MMSLRYRFIASAAALVASVAASGCSSKIKRLVALPVSIDAQCNAQPFEVSILEDGQVQWKPSNAGAVIYFPQTPFNQQTYTINGATATSSGPVNATAKRCAETKPPGTCKYKYTVSVASAACSIDPRVVVTR